MRSDLDPDEVELIRAMLRFVNEVDETWTQDQVYGIFLPLSQVEKRQNLECTIEAVFQGIPESEGIRPFLNDRLFVWRVLTAIAKKNGLELEKLRGDLSGKLGRTLALKVTPHIDEKGTIDMDFRPLLAGVEACIYYGLAVLFKNRLDKLVRVCPVTRDDGEPCNKIFLYNRYGERRYCAEHSALGKKQKFQQWHNDKREQADLPPMKWGSKPRKRSRRKQKRAN